MYYFWHHDDLHLKEWKTPIPPVELSRRKRFEVLTTQASFTAKTYAKLYHYISDQFVLFYSPIRYVTFIFFVGHNQ